MFAAITLLALSVAVPSAEPEDATFDADLVAALVGRDVIVTLHDNSEVRGKLLRGTTTKLVIEKAGGELATLEPRAVVSLKAVPAPASISPGASHPSVQPAAAGSAPPPPDAKSTKDAKAEIADLRAVGDQQMIAGLLWGLGGGVSLACAGASAFGALFVTLAIIFLPATACFGLAGVGLVGFGAYEFFGGIGKKEKAKQLENAMAY